MLFEEFCEEKLDGPVFIRDYPVEVSPLARRCSHDSRFITVLRHLWPEKKLPTLLRSLSIPGPAERFEMQASRRNSGDDEAHMMDEDLPRWSTGMPPTGGLGIEVDRLVMILTDSPSIRDVILFPTMKPRSKFTATLALFLIRRRRSMLAEKPPILIVLPGSGYV